MSWTDNLVNPLFKTSVVTAIADGVVTYEEMQPLTVKILQDIIEPHMGVMEEYFARRKSETEKRDED